MEVRVKDFSNDRNAVERSSGVNCRDYIYSNYKEKDNKIILNFQDVDSVLTRFLNPIISGVFDKYGKEFRGKLFIKNYDEDIASKVNIVYASSLSKLSK